MGGELKKSKHEVYIHISNLSNVINHSTENSTGWLNCRNLRFNIKRWMTSIIWCSSPMAGSSALFLTTIHISVQENRTYRILIIGHCVLIVQCECTLIGVDLANNCQKLCWNQTEYNYDFTTQNHQVILQNFRNL